MSDNTKKHNTEARKRYNRAFKKREDVKWLSEKDKQSRRKNLAQFILIATLLERDQKLDAEQLSFVISMSDSKDKNSQLDCMWRLIETSEIKFQKELAAMAPYSLAAYHEMMNPLEAPAKHHLFMCEKLEQVAEGKIMTLGFILPPGAAKSSYASRSFAQWYMGKFPDKRVLGAIHSSQFGENEISKPNRGAVGSDLFKLAFPDVTINPNEKAAGFWRLDGWKGSYTLRGAGAGMSGIRTHLLSADDLYKSAADAMSPTIRESVDTWWFTDVMPRLLPNAPTVLVNTVWNSEDVISKMQRRNEQYHEELKTNPNAKSLIAQPAEIINIPAYAESNDPIGRQEGERLWPEFYSDEHYELKKLTLSAPMWNALYCGKAIDSVGGHILIEQFQRYDNPPVNLPNQPIQWSKCVMTVDTAAKGNDRSDYTAIHVYRRGTDGHHYLVDAIQIKENMDKLVVRLAIMAKRWTCNYIVLEDSGIGMQILENYKHKMPCTLIPYNPAGKGSKEFRFDAAVPWVTGGKILFPKQAPWLTDLINQFLAFPHSKNDDHCDAFSIYCDHELKTRKGGTKKLSHG
jgi:predicted phage terminase large subunit-like protein